MRGVVKNDRRPLLKTAEIKDDTVDEVREGNVSCTQQLDYVKSSAGKVE